MELAARLARELTERTVIEGEGFLVEGYKKENDFFEHS